MRWFNAAWWVKFNGNVSNLASEVWRTQWRHLVLWPKTKKSSVLSSNVFKLLYKHLFNTLMISLFLLCTEGFGYFPEPERRAAQRPAEGVFPPVSSHTDGWKWTPLNVLQTVCWFKLYPDLSSESWGKKHIPSNTNGSNHHQGAWRAWSDWVETRCCLQGISVCVVEDTHSSCCIFKYNRLFSKIRLYWSRTETIWREIKGLKLVFVVLRSERWLCIFSVCPWSR